MAKDIPEEVIKGGQVVVAGLALYLIFKIAKNVANAKQSVGQAIQTVADEIGQQYTEAKAAVEKTLVQGDNPVNNTVNDTVSAIAGAPENLGGAFYDLSHHPVDTIKAYWRNHFGGSKGDNPSVVTKQGQVVAGAAARPTNDQQMRTLIGAYKQYGESRSAGGIPAGRPSAQSDVAMGELTISGGSPVGDSSDQPGTAAPASANVNIPVGTSTNPGLDQNNPTNILGLGM